MKRYGVVLLVLIGLLVVAAGTVELLREAGVITLELDVFGSILIVMLGLWITACALECRRLIGQS